MGFASERTPVFFFVTRKLNIIFVVDIYYNIYTRLYNNILFFFTLLLKVTDKIIIILIKII